MSWQLSESKVDPMVTQPDSGQNLTASGTNLRPPAHPPRSCRGLRVAGQVHGFLGRSPAHVLGYMVLHLKSQGSSANHVLK